MQSDQGPTPEHRRPIEHHELHTTVANGHRFIHSLGAVMARRVHEKMFKSL